MNLWIPARDSCLQCLARDRARQGGAFGGDRQSGFSETGNRNMKINTWRELEVYQSAFVLQQRIFEFSKLWPSEERYSLTDQIRRSSRSIGANIAEAWAKRRYPAHFLSKLTDSDGELQETLHWLESAKACGYVSDHEADDLVQLASQVGRQLGSMINRHESFCF